MRLRRALDKLFGCTTTEQVGYTVEDGSIWRETISFCERCEEIVCQSRRRLRADEFWEDDALYLMPFSDRK